MFKALKNLGRRTLSLLLFLILVPILLIIILVLLQSCERRVSYTKYESKMLVAARKYFTVSNLIPQGTDEVSYVSLETLVEKGYIKSPEKLLKDSSCTGFVTLRKNGVMNDDASDLSSNYVVNLTCENYNSKSLLSEIMKDLTETGSGLYLTSDGYVFKGDKVNNYITFYGIKYRIMSADTNGVVKLIKTEPQNITRYWDTKYNIDVDSSVGINIYKDSSILSGLLLDYSSSKNFLPEAKQHMISHDACVGRRTSGDLQISHALDCSEVFENQVVFLPNISDYALASLDINCNSLRAKSCRNYNYLSGILQDAWTSNVASDNTYQVYYFRSGMVYLDNASEYHSYNLVIYIDGDEPVKSGSGTYTDPYIMG